MNIRIREQTSDPLRQTQLVQLELLKELHRVCCKHKLTYWLSCGSLLGAVRHGGFIPWDDDIDVSMPINDYKKLISIASEEFSDDIFFQTPEMKFSAMPFSKMRDCYSIYFDKGESGLSPNAHYGIFLDIFPFYEYPNLPKKAFDFLTRFSCAITRHTWLTGNVSFSSLVKCSFLKILNNLALKPFWWCMGKIGGKMWAHIPYANTCGFRLHPDTLFPLSTVVFEGHEFCAPNDTHTYLQTLYGDYMQLPPENKRHNHALLVLPKTPCAHPAAKKWIFD